MITKSSGKLDGIKNDSIIIENGGFFYQIFVANNILKRIRNTRKIGETITLYTIYYLEGNVSRGNLTPRLIGFLDELDREFFEYYITVRGLGERKALKSLILPIRSIALAIENEDKQILRELPGIGSRMADKIIAELKGKLAKFALIRGSERISEEEEEKYDFKSEAMEVLLQLEYRRQEAENLIEKALQKNNKISTSEELIQEIFKHRNK